MPIPNDAIYYAALGRLGIVLDRTSRDDAVLRLAGVIPCRKVGDMVEVLLVKPEHRKKELLPPQFQIGKGTRMWKPGNEWVDIRVEDVPLARNAEAEPLAVAALREAHEELGLLPGSITTLTDIGVHDFSSTRSGDVKQMALFIAEVEPALRLVAPDVEHGKSAEVAWVPVTDFAAHVRPDHAAILSRVLRDGQVIENMV